MKSLLYLFLSISIVVNAQNKGMIPTKPNGETERRLALVIGNKDYQTASLKNPVNDANDMALTLENLGFTVLKYTNLRRDAFEKVIDDFATQLNNYDVGLFYYSGHGIQAQGENYLVPVDVGNIPSEPMIRYTCVEFGRVLAAMEGSRASTNLAILDACRNNPYKKSWTRGNENEGLATPRNPPGTCIVFATSEGKTADDNASDRNGLFTKALLQHISKPNISLSTILNDTRKMVYEQSNKKQLPADYIKLLGDFYFLSQNNTHSNIQVEPQPIKDLPFGPEMVYIKGGSFDMGSNEGLESEKPVHTVTVNGFSMAKYETTVREFAQFVAETNYKTDAEKQNGSYLWNPITNEYLEGLGINWQYGADGERLMSGMYNHPVVHVSHNDAVAFCEWLSKKTGKTYRLPTEAEWEYAAGNGSKHTKYSWGDGEPVGLVGNIFDETFHQKFPNLNRTRFNGYTDGYAYPAPVGSFKSNVNGLYDMTGNVSEWCSDWYDKTYYASSPSTNPMGASSGTNRVLRGGSWCNYPRSCRVAYRDIDSPSFRNNFVGFRVVSP